MFKKLKKSWLNNYHKLNQKQKNIFFIFSLFLILTIALSAVVAYHYLQKNEEAQENLVPETTFTNPFNSDTSQIEADDQKELNVLLIGYGGAGHQGGMLADLMQIAHLDFEKQTITFISIPRDLEIQLENANVRKINNIFSYYMTGQNPIINAGENTKDVLSNITSLPIKYFIAVDFVGFQRLIGQELGGIEVEVAKEFRDSWYPIEGKQLDPCGFSEQEIAQLTATLSGFELEKQFACRYEEIYFPSGLQKMEGGDALKYVRSRHSSSDFDRSRRQVEVLTGIRKKLFDLEALAKVPQFFKQVSSHVHTNFNLEILEYLAPLLVKANNFQVQTINLSTENVLLSKTSSNGSVLIPKAGQNNWGELQNFIGEALN
jgi:anionic cell wall polymer biosynthesis LytR-Cps2A-Psr (LCP) family protein